MTPRTLTPAAAQRLNRAIDAAVRAMMVIPQAVLFTAMVLVLVMASQALPWIAPAWFA